MTSKDFQYAYWRTDKEKDPGYSHELISTDSEFFVKMGTTLDELDADPLPGINTIPKALARLAEKFPNGEYLGTRVGQKYEWLTFREVQDIAKNLSKGIVEFEMVPEMTDDDGKVWKFMGIMSKNRKEWNLLNHAGAYQGVTTVAFYDTLSEDATAFIVN